MALNGNDQSFIEAVNQAGYVVGLSRLEEGGRGKSSWNTEYDYSIFFRNILEQTFRIEIEESLDSYFRTGKIFISDRSSVMAYFPLTGSEIVTVQYWNALEDKATEKKKKILHFSISHVEELLNRWEGYEKGSRIIVLHVIEAPIFQSLTQNSRYKTFDINGGDRPLRSLSDVRHPTRNSSISNLMGEVLQDDILRKWYGEVNIEPTKSTEEFKINFYIPNWPISKTLNYLKKFAVSKDDYPYYIFYTLPPEKEGQKPSIHLKPIYSLFEEKSYQVFSQNIAPELFRPPVSGEDEVVDYNSGDYPFDPLNIFTNYRINLFNAIQTLFSGLSGETFFTLDYIEDNKYVGHDYHNFIEGHKGLGDFSIHAFDYGNQWSTIRKHSFNEPQRLLSMKRNEFAKRQLQSAISCVTQGTMNHTRKIGDMADMIFRSPLGDLENPEYFQDQIFSGRWLIWAQKDIMTMDNAYSICHFVKEGYSQDVSKSKVDFNTILNKFSKNLHPRQVNE